MGEGAAGPPPVKLPDRPPIPSDVEDRAAFDKLADSSLDDVRGAADKWRGGLAALVTLVTGGLLIKGPSAASDLTTGWRAAVTLLGAAGIGLAIVGLWAALRASAGIPRTQDFGEVVGQYGSVRVFKLAQAEKAAAALQTARQSLLLALPLLGAAVIVWWWAPTKPPSPPAYVQVDLPAPAAPICGVLKSADNGHLRIQVSGEENPRVIPLARIANLRVKASC
jgi:hypothetical protein